MKAIWRYINHWFGYCYYRCIPFYSKKNETPEYFDASVPFITFFIAIGLILAKNGIILMDNKGEVFPYAIIMTIVLPLFFNKKKYDKMKAIFGTESNATRIILGFLVAATFIVPVVMAVIYLFCF